MALDKFDLMGRPINVGRPKGTQTYVARRTAQLTPCLPLGYMPGGTTSLPGLGGAPNPNTVPGGPSRPPTTYVASMPAKVGGSLYKTREGCAFGLVANPVALSRSTKSPSQSPSQSRQSC